MATMWMVMAVIPTAQLVTITTALQLRHSETQTQTSAQMFVPTLTSKIRLLSSAIRATTLVSRATIPLTVIRVPMSATEFSTTANVFPNRLTSTITH